MCEWHCSALSASGPDINFWNPSNCSRRRRQKKQRRDRPWTWRPKVHYNDTTIELGVAPDYPFAILYPDGRFRAYLVECDRGTMPVDRANLEQTSLKRKFLAYAAARRANLLQEHFGWKAFRVLLITTNRQRADNALQIIRECVHEHLRGLFLIADRQSLASADFISFPW